MTFNGAIMQLVELVQHPMMPKMFQSAFDKVIETLSEVNPEPHWIPCSERLPEDDGRYLVTNSRIGGWVIDIDLMLHGKWVHEADNHIAWREIPEPYKSEEEAE